MVRVTTLPAFCIRYSSNRNSRGCKTISSDRRVTLCDSRSSIRSGTLSTVSSGAPLGPRRDRAARREDQDRRLVFLLAKRADQREAVHFRQHAVDDGDVISAFERQIVSGDG